MLNRALCFDSDQREYVIVRLVFAAAHFDR